MVLFYPIFSRIGLKSNWREAVFLSFGGLRGSVGIALAVNFYNNVRSNATTFEEHRLASVFVFLSGGISLLSLLINGTAAGKSLFFLEYRPFLFPPNYF